MPKTDTAQGKTLNSLVKQLDGSHSPDEPPARDPVLQLVVAFLQWEATRKQAEDALGRIMEHMVDVNDLRVSFEQEVLELLGEDYPNAHERVARMREALNDIYVREYAVEMHSIADKGKKDQRAYLDSLAGVPPYVAAEVMLVAFGGHAMPVDQKLIERLAEEQIIDENDTDPQHVENVLLRLVRADEAMHVHLLLQAWADDRFTRRRAAAKRGTQKSAASRSGSATNRSRSRNKRKTTKKKTTSTTKRSSSRRGGQQ